MIKRILTSILVLVALASTACGPDTGSLEIYIVKSPNSAQDPLNPDLISHLKIRVTGDNLLPIEDTFEFEEGGTSTLSEIPAGKNRVVTVEGLAGLEGFAISRGRSVPFEMNAGRQQIELFMARIGRFSVTSGSGLTEARFGQATTIDSDGQLWIVGGASAGTAEDPEQFLRSYEIYDPTSGFVLTDNCIEDPTLCLTEQRADASCALTDDGIFVAGGRNSDGPLSSTEEITLDSHRSEPAAPLDTPQYGATAVALEAETLLAGGRGSGDSVVSTALLVDRDGDTQLFEMPLARAALAGARSIDDVFLFGGLDEADSASSDYLLFDTSDSQFTGHISDAVPRAHASAVSFSDGRVLVMGGESADGTPSDAVDLYDPRIGALCPIGQLGIPRSRAAAASLPDGRALLMGGLTGALAPSATAHVEIVDARFIELSDDCSILTGSLQSDPTDRLQVARHSASGHLLPNGFITVVGGLGQNAEPVAQIEVYVPE